MRVLHLPVNNGSRTSHTVRALREVGIDAHGLVRTSALVQSPKGLSIHNLGSHRPSRQMLRALVPWIVDFIRYVRWADVVHWYSGAMALPLGLDLALVRLLRKPGLVEWQGVEIRIPEVEFAENPYYTAAYANGYEYRQLESRARSRRLQTRFRAAGFASAAPVGMLQYVERDIFPEVYTLPRRLLLPDYAPARPRSDETRPLVVHSPTAPVTKGTAAVLKAVEAMRGRHEFDFRLVQGMARSEALRLVRESSIFLDQFVLGDYGSAALEAMALGKPVICYVKPSLLTQYPADLPIVSATQEELSAALEMLLTDGQLRARLGRQGRAYVEKHNDARKVALELKNIYSELIAARSRRGGRGMRTTGGNRT